MLKDFMNKKVKISVAFAKEQSFNGLPLASLDYVGVLTDENDDFAILDGTTALSKKYILSVIAE